MQPTLHINQLDSTRAAWAAHLERQEDWAGPYWSNYQHCLEGAQLAFTWCVQHPHTHAVLQDVYVTKVQHS
jgi:hypothetical protein